jgi:hypothetical protein
MAVSAAALYDLIRDILQQGGVSGQVQFAEQSTADGSVLLQVTAADPNP